MSGNIDIKSLVTSFQRLLRGINKYKGFIFFILLTSLYGFIVWRINVLSSAPPSEADLAKAQQNVSSPKIPAATVEKLQGLQDNSVRVQALFNEARQNPFQE
ncbi:hypothetical protein KDA14_00010 [Candidatus Saccharibacteria bacterium]|nr:hypothetical protein [Candidatus Saccharibacteria bacterium]